MPETTTQEPDKDRERQTRIDWHRDQAIRFAEQMIDLRTQADRAERRARHHFEAMKKLKHGVPLASIAREGE